MSNAHETGMRRVPRYLLLGLLTVAPLWVTWLVFDFVFRQLSALGGPWVAMLAEAIAARFPETSALVATPGFQSACGVVLTLLVLITVGWLAGNIIGQRIIHWLERLVLNVPLVASIYGGTKRFLSAMKEKPRGLQRVVLISFPTDNMKAVGLVTKIIRDTESDRELAVVYVPTAPNPTSGYIEIVPVEFVVSTDWTIDEAMSFVMTGGVTSPDRVRFRADGDPAA
ncbi:MAG TPA: hypothetical protein DCR65_10150 [Gammaproteobacteria bacterium]|nr:hypothetical protein [Gammaproteobacteria bacterium]